MDGQDSQSVLKLTYLLCVRQYVLNNSFELAAYCLSLLGWVRFFRKVIHTARATGIAGADKT